MELDPKSSIRHFWLNLTWREIQFDLIRASTTLETKLDWIGNGCGSVWQCEIFPFELPVMMKNFGTRF